MIQDEEEAGLLEQLKSQICDNIAMYAQKYDEEFAPHLPLFVTAVWNLLINTGHQPKYDMVRILFFVKLFINNIYAPCHLFFKNNFEFDGLKIT